MKEGTLANDPLTRIMDSIKNFDLYEKLVKGLQKVKKRVKSTNSGRIVFYF